MPSEPNGRFSLPGWMRLLISMVICLHLAAILGNVLAAPSGPWPMMEGADWASPPQFAQSLIGTPVSPKPLMKYLRFLGLTHNYHFETNTFGDLGMNTRFEAHLKDESGEVVKYLKFPDPEAGFAVRHRQILLAQGLYYDEFVEPPEGEFVPPPGEFAKTVRYWDWEIGDNRVARIRTIAVHLTRDRELWTPSDRAMVLARSFARHLCRKHGAASVEIRRYDKEFIPPDVFDWQPPPPEENFAETTWIFGEFDAP